MGTGIELTLNLRTPYNDRDLFLNTVLEIEPNKRCAVYGVNGAGKTCLFHAIATGQIPKFPDHVHVHHMKEPEHNEAADALSVIDSVLCSHRFRRVLLPIEAKLRSLIETTSDAALKSKYQDNLTYIESCLNSIQSATALKRAQGMLRVLGFDEKGELAPVSSLSGGLRMRVALASAFFIEPALLLLDEPTNHLDLPSVLWLENKLRGYKGSFLLVTHDRRLLENVVTSVMLIQDLKLEYFACGFKEFEKRKKQMDKDREKMVDNWMKKNRNVDPSSCEYPLYKRYRDWQIARSERAKLMANKFTFKAPSPLTLTNGAVNQAQVSLIKVDNVRFSYDHGVKLPFIFDNPVSYEITMSTRVGIMGPNGAGKSTFLKLITGKEKATEGNIIINPEFTLAYFGQHSTKELTLELSAREFMEKSFPTANPGHLMLHLEKTGISSGYASTAMSNLSFSQRSCVIFAKLTFVSPHLLILDEPTNFLDLDSVDSLIHAVTSFPGALIIVTHNRDFLQRCSRDYLSIIPGHFLEFPDMKSAERATYSFISALEEGLEVDVKKAIQQNRGGGAVHTEDEQEARRAALSAQQLKAKAKADAEEAERKAIEAAKAEKEAKLQAKVAAQRLDWVADEMVYVNAKGKWQQAKVIRNVAGVGVTVQLLSDNTMSMVNANKLKEEDPTPPKVAGGAGGRGGASGGRGGSTGGRGAAVSAGGAGGRGAQGSSGRGGNTRGRGGAGARGGYGPGR
jgi:ATPase subunit of ABC transporter with duplicated ATPase domains